MNQKGILVNSDIFYLEYQLTDKFVSYLETKSWILPNEKVLKIEKPGEGNMNFVMRVITNQRSFILKQSRAFVQKYPQIAAPIERIEVETRFYQAIENDDFLQKFSPKILGFDLGNFILALEDLGNGADLMNIYQKGENLTETDLESLLNYLSQLHTHQNIDFPENRKMRLLNHEHLFNYPFLEENGFDLDIIQEGLQEISMKYKQNEGLKSKIHEFGNEYLSVQKTLIHGDFYFGSFLKIEEKIKIIDPEFAFLGFPEFDLAVLIAHLKMAQQNESLIEKAINLYKKTTNFNEKRLWAFVGIEILRRIIGIAQLPLSLTLNEKEKLLEEAENLIL